MGRRVVSRRGVGRGRGLDSLDDDGLLDEDGAGGLDAGGDGHPLDLGHDIPHDGLLVKLLVVVDGAGSGEGGAQHAEDGGRAHGLSPFSISGSVIVYPAIRETGHTIEGLAALLYDAILSKNTKNDGTMG
jgi:hypothetical protein